MTGLNAKVRLLGLKINIISISADVQTSKKIFYLYFNLELKIVVDKKARNTGLADKKICSSNCEK